MGKLPPTRPSLTGALHQQRRAIVAQSNSNPFAGSGLTPGGSYATTAYVDTNTASQGLEVPYAALTIPAATETAVPWSAPTENTGGFTVSGSAITIPLGMGGVYSISVALSVAASQPTRAYLNLNLGASRIHARSPFTGDTDGSVSATARLTDATVFHIDIYCATATSLAGGWLALYRLHP